jgi:RNA methyltransferase, TrmH family
MNNVIRSTRNPRIIETRKLSQRKHRLKQDRFAAEGLQVLRMAVEAIEASPQHVRPFDVFFCEDLFTSDSASTILRALVSAGAAATPVTQQVLETLSSRVLSQGLVATFAISPKAPPLTMWEMPSPGSPSLVILVDRPQYPGNVGTLIRTADAVGASGVILVEPAADAFDPKAVRASMGSIFSVPVTRLKDVREVAAWSDRNGICWVTADVSGGDAVWESDALRGSVGLVLGNEGSGPQEAVRVLARHVVHLPQRGHAESLNVSVAGGILMYEWMRVNRPRT